MWHQSFVQILETSYEKMKLKNPQYSRRAFARKLGISSGMLSDVTKGKARFTKKRAFEIIEKIEIPKKEKARLLVLLGKSSEIAQDIPASDKYLILYDWVYRTILFAFDIEKFKPTADILSEKLGLPLAEVQDRIATLLELGLLHENEDGEILRSKVIWRVPQENSKDFAHKLYASNIEVAKKAITQVSAAQRDFTTVTFAGNSEQLDKVRQEIQELYARTLAIMEEPQTDRVYQMSIFLHPLDVKGFV
ncbi:TIGR02147 family protein [Bdellovibrio bacteriovorus]|uniref:TIGR02147 family protein n=1 Tax=Bdellovibrio bacteriovorus TaxID=959 RepID=UPI0035A9A29C